MEKKVIIVVALVSIVINLLLLLPYIEKEENALENNKINRDKTYAIMVQNEDKTGYIESTSNTFPSDMTLNEELTNCVDESGTKVDNPFAYENGIITVRTNKKIYCYLYFDTKSGITSGSDLILNPTSGLNTTLEGGLYRYQGASGTVDNYICFGTSDKDTCLNNTDAHMYRIIGISEDGKIKIMKKEAMNSTIRLGYNSTTNYYWTNSIVYYELNHAIFLTNETYMPSGWSDKIETTTWKYGDNTNVDMMAEELYDIENAWTSTTNAKIGLVYAHDYAYAYQSGGLNCSGNGSYSTCKTSWMHLSNNDLEAPFKSEWLMSRYGYHADSNTYNGYIINFSGVISYFVSSNSYSIRPVLYLKSTVQFEDGTGKSTDPFIIQ